MKKTKQLLFLFLLSILLSSCKGKINVEFRDYDNEIIESYTVADLKEIIEPDISRVGYDFIGWKVESLLDTKITYIAEYSPKSYSISFESVYEDIPDLEVYYGQEVELPKVTKDAYKFLYYEYQNREHQSKFNYLYEEDIKLKAVYNDYLVSVDEFTSFIQDLDDLIESSNQYYNEITIRNYIRIVDESFGKQYFNSKVVIGQKIDKENLYFETSILNDGKLAGYEIIRNYDDLLSLDTLLFDNDHYDLNSISLMNKDDYIHEDIKFNEKWNVDGVYSVVRQNYYKTTTKFKYIASNVVDLEMIAASTGLSIHSLENMDIEFEIEFNEFSNEYTVYINISNFYYLIEGMDAYLNLNISFQISEFNNPIKQMDYNEINAHYLAPSNPDEITRITDFNEVITSYHFANPHWYLVEFEEGVYTATLSGIYSSGPGVKPSNLEIQDLDGNSINMGPLWGNEAAAYEPSFIIPSSGLYLIRVGYSPNSGYKMKFNKQDFKDYSDYNNPDIINSTNEFTLERIYDYKYLNHNSTDSGVLFITLESFEALYDTKLDTEYIVVYWYSIVGERYIYKELRLNDTFSYETRAGDNPIIIGSNYNSKVIITTDFIKTN